MRDIAEAARAYSMASMPGEEVLEFHVRLIPGGRASQHIAETLKVGDSVQVEGPYGSAHLRPDDDSPLVLVAGSTGLDPATSIARTALMMPQDHRVHPDFGERAPDHVIDDNPRPVLGRHPGKH